MSSAFILFYHSVSENVDYRIDPTIVVHPARFEQQLRYLSTRMHVISLADLVNALRSRQAIPPHSAVITFDDGYRDNFTIATPLLQRYNLPATFFLATGYIGTGRLKWEDRLSYILHTSRASHIHIEHASLSGGTSSLVLSNRQSRARTFTRLSARLERLPAQAREQVIDQVRELADITTKQLCGDVMLTWDEVREMTNVADFTFGCHTVSHERFSMLPDEQVQFEISRSRRTVEEEIGSEVSFFAYPYGTRKDFDDRTVQVLRNDGFDCAVTTVYGRTRFHSDLFRLNRVIGADTTGIRFGLGTRVRASLVGQPVRSIAHLLTRFV